MLLSIFTRVGIRIDYSKDGRYLLILREGYELILFMIFWILILATFSTILYVAADYTILFFFLTKRGDGRSNFSTRVLRVISLMLIPTICAIVFIPEGRTSNTDFGYQTFPISDIILSLLAIGLLYGLATWVRNRVALSVQKLSSSVSPDECEDWIELDTLVNTVFNRIKNPTYSKLPALNQASQLRRSGLHRLLRPQMQFYTMPALPALQISDNLYGEWVGLGKLGGSVFDKVNNWTLPKFRSTQSQYNKLPDQPKAQTEATVNSTNDDRSHKVALGSKVHAAEEVLLDFEQNANAEIASTLFFAKWSVPAMFDACRSSGREPDVGDILILYATDLERDRYEAMTFRKYLAISLEYMLPTFNTISNRQLDHDSQLKLLDQWLIRFINNLCWFISDSRTKEHDFTEEVVAGTKIHGKANLRVINFKITGTNLELKAAMMILLHNTIAVLSSAKNGIRPVEGISEEIISSYLSFCQTSSPSKIKITTPGSTSVALYKGAKSYCWKPIFEGANCIAGIPNPSEPNRPPGLKVDFNTLLHLSAIRKEILYNGGIVLLGHETALIPLKDDTAGDTDQGTSFMRWHFACTPGHQVTCAVADAFGDKRLLLKRLEEVPEVAVVGFSADAVNRLGSKEISTLASWSQYEPVKSHQSTIGYAREINLQVNPVPFFSFGGRLEQSRASLPTRVAFNPKRDHAAILSEAAGKFYIICDDANEQSWLVRGIYLLLNCVQLHLHLNQYEGEPPSYVVALDPPSQPLRPRADFSSEWVSNLEDWSSENSHIFFSKQAYSVFSCTTKVRSTDKTTIPVGAEMPNSPEGALLLDKTYTKGNGVLSRSTHDLIASIWIDISLGEELCRNPATQRLLNSSSVLKGVELYDLAKGSSIELKQATVKESMKAWNHLTSFIPVIFCRGVGDLICPRASLERNVCTSQGPYHKGALTCLTSDLREACKIAARQMAPGEVGWKFYGCFEWVFHGDPFAVCTHRSGQRRTCWSIDRLQAITKAPVAGVFEKRLQFVKSMIGNITGISPPQGLTTIVEIPPNGAVRFGKNT